MIIRIHIYQNCVLCLVIYYILYIYIIFYIFPKDRQQEENHMLLFLSLFLYDLSSCRRHYTVLTLFPLGKYFQSQK